MNKGPLATCQQQDLVTQFRGHTLLKVLNMRNNYKNIDLVWVNTLAADLSGKLANHNSGLTGWANLPCHKGCG